MTTKGIILADDLPVAESQAEAEARWAAEKLAARQEAIDTFGEELSAIIDECDKLGIERIEVEFSGSGDDGQINEVAFLKVGYDKIDVYNDRLIKVSADLLDQVHELVYAALEKQPTNWCDNEGGQGHWHLDLTAGEIDFVVDYNEVVAHTGHSATVSFK